MTAHTADAGIPRPRPSKPGVPGAPPIPIGNPASGPAAGPTGGRPGRLPKRVLQIWEIAARQRNARLSTGPKTAAGKRRSSLNAWERNLYPAAPRLIFPAALFDDPRFRRIQRDLIGLLRPMASGPANIVTCLSFGWWRKAVRLGGGDAYGIRIPDDVADIDDSIELLLRQYVRVMQLRRLKWYVRLTRTLGSDLGHPSDVRRAIETRLGVFGWKNAGFDASPEHIDDAKFIRLSNQALMAEIRRNGGDPEAMEWVGAKLTELSLS